MSVHIPSSFLPLPSPPAAAGSRAVHGHHFEAPKPLVEPRNDCRKPPRLLRAGLLTAACVASGAPVRLYTAADGKQEEAKQRNI